MDDGRVDGYKSIPMANAIAVDESKKTRRRREFPYSKRIDGIPFSLSLASRTWPKLYRSSLPTAGSSFPSIRGVKQAILSDPRRRRTRGANGSDRLIPDAVGKEHTNIYSLYRKNLGSYYNFFHPLRPAGESLILKEKNGIKGIREGDPLFIIEHRGRAIR